MEDAARVSEAHERRTQALKDALEVAGLVPQDPFPCPYLPGRAARQAFVRPRAFLPGLYHAFLDLNFRRLGRLVYRPACEGCRECRSLRVIVKEFHPTRAQRRCLTRNADVTIEVGPPAPTDEKLALYRRYLESRHDGQMSGAREEFEQFLYDAPPLAKEIVYRVGGRLLGAGIADFEPRALSAVYFYFDPDEAARSPGVFNVLSLLAECQRRELPWLYLGYYVAGSPRMAYKARYRPHELMDDDGRWQRSVSA